MDFNFIHPQNIFENEMRAQNTQIPTKKKVKVNKNPSQEQKKRPVEEDASNYEIDLNNVRILFCLPNL